MAYSPVARQRLLAYRNETPEERSARHDRERQQRATRREEKRVAARAVRIAKMRLAMWYRERERT